MIIDVAWYQINYIILLYPLRLLYCISFILHPSVEELNELHKKIMAATDEAKVGDYMKLQDYRIMVDLLALKIFLRESCFAWPTEQDPTHTQPKIHQSKIRKCFDQAMDIPLDIIITSCDTSWHMLSQLISAALQGCGLTGAREGKIVPAGGEATASQTHQAISEGQEWRLGTSGDFGRIMFPSSSHHVASIPYFSFQRCLMLLWWNSGKTRRIQVFVTYHIRFCIYGLGISCFLLWGGLDNIRLQILAEDYRCLLYVSSVFLLDVFGCF